MAQKLPFGLRLLLAACLILSMVLPAGQVTKAASEDCGMQGTAIEIGAHAFGLPLIQDAITALYGRDSVRLQAGQSFRVMLEVPETGDYLLRWDAVSPAEMLSAPIGQVRVDDAFPTPAWQRIAFPMYYRNSAATFPKDRYGNDALIRQERELRWSKADVWDVQRLGDAPQSVFLSAGQHRLDFTLSEGELYLGSLYLERVEPLLSYAAYRAACPFEAVNDFSVTLEAEFPAYKNDTAVRPMSSRSLEVTPYDTYRLLLNTLGGSSWTKSGSAVYYKVNVPQDGLYQITLHAQQNMRSNFTVFRRITVNGQVPFEEWNAFAFRYSDGWLNVPLVYEVFLHQGENIIGLESTAAPYRPAVETIQQALLDINSLALEIKKLTGNQRDPYKEWVISDYIPDIRERLNTILEHLEADQNLLLTVSGGVSSPEVLTYQMAMDNLQFLAENPDRIPTYMNRFSEGSGSAAQLLGSLLPLLQSQPLTLDTITIHSADRLPQQPKVSFGRSLSEGFKRFVYTFQPNPYQSLGADEGELEVWVNRPRVYVDLLQLMSDETFTPQTGIRVKFSIMPDESKLVLANAAGIQPDVALGVSTNVPYELAVRNALYDLRSFEDFDSFINIYSPGALLSYVLNDSVYALPETQDFWVTFYRKDILDSLGIPVPHTWNEVIEILPELQRYGMNYNTPLSSGAGLKGYLVTAPYLFNYGAQLYSADGFSTGLQSEEAIAAIRFMAESFTMYGMPLTTASFYESFRYGTLPIGVSNFETYIKLRTAAPEIDGLWKIDLYPATVLPDGRQNRYATGSAQACIMFKNAKHPQEAWQFMKWWMSTETQTEFQERLVLNYGPEYLWNSANLQAFARLDIPEEHKQVILEQWQWLQEPVRLPGSYMQERELSNVWNRIVFDGANPRVALDRAVIVINREIRRKMEEFGYLQDGKPVREFKVPTLETVKGWQENGR